ncbi:MAG: HTTM domain-containing protein, partial [Candidatus Eremiobacteraeota bacterium]|nr:HTTM domain-containing protein [Candidatus Eremiobacteraeota bacterium]
MTRWTELDPRSLAVFRIVLGCLVALDTLWRVPFLNDFMTDEGVYSRLDMTSSAYADYWICLHLGSGNLLGQSMLTLLILSLAAGLIAGYRTTWMTLGCWIMMNSVQARNPFIGDRGDLQLSLLLFWALFLPLGEVWSLDAKAKRASFGYRRGAPVVGLILQFASIYLFAALTKTGDFWLARGDGLKFSLLSPLFATDVAALWLKLGDPMLKALNYSVIVGELFLGLLLLCPLFVPLCRSLAVGALVVFHLVVLVTFKLGLFPIIGALTPLALLPTEFWTRFFKKEKPDDPPTTPLPLNLVLGLFIGLALLSSVANSRPAISRPQALTRLTEILRLEQHWELFSPLPPINGHFRLISLDSNQERILFEGPPFPGHRWKMLMLAT